MSKRLKLGLELRAVVDFAKPLLRSESRGLSISVVYSALPRLHGFRLLSEYVREMCR